MGVGAAALYADTSTLHIGFGVGTACSAPTTNNATCLTDPNRLTSGVRTDRVDIYNVNGTGGFVNPMLLILGVPLISTTPNANLFSSTPIKSVAEYPTPQGGTSIAMNWAYGDNSTQFPLGHAANSYGYAGDFTSSFKSSSGPSDVYSFLGLPNVNGSENITNWDNTYTNWASPFTATPGAVPSGFGIYVFSLFVPSATQIVDPVVNVIFSSPFTLPVGTYVVAFAENWQGKAYGTAFTNTGMQGPNAPTPEPLAILLMGSVLVFSSVLLKRYRGPSSK